MLLPWNLTWTLGSHVAMAATTRIPRLTQQVGLIALCVGTLLCVCLCRVYVCVGLSVCLSDPTLAGLILPIIVSRSVLQPVDVLPTVHTTVGDRIHR